MCVYLTPRPLVSDPDWLHSNCVAGPEPDAWMPAVALAPVPNIVP